MSLPYLVRTIRPVKMAAERRARIAGGERKPFYVYVASLQNFATLLFEDAVDLTQVQIVFGP